LFPPLELAPLELVEPRLLVLELVLPLLPVPPPLPDELPEEEALLAVVLTPDPPTVEAWRQPTQPSETPEMGVVETD
jgi:hypothetical protein